MGEEGKIMISHGVGNITLKTYCLPPEPLKNFNPSRNELGYYVTTGEV
jgi:hypothetical protein